MFVQTSNFHYTQVLLLTQQQKKHIFDKKTTGDVFKITKDHVFYKKEETQTHPQNLKCVVAISKTISKISRVVYLV